MNNILNIFCLHLYNPTIEVKKNQYHNAQCSVFFIILPNKILQNLLFSGGQKLSVSLNMKVNKPQFTHENLQRLQVLKSDSDRGIKKVAQAIRHVFGRNSVEAGLSQKLTERNQSLEQFFEVRSFSLKVKPGTNNSNKEDVSVLDENGYVDINVPGVVAKDLDTLVKEVVDSRQYNAGDIEVICGLDNGQNFNKIGFIVKEKTSNSSEENPKGLFNNSFKDSGVKKLILAAVIPNCPENYHNQKNMLCALGLSGLEWGTTVDLKMALCLCGKSGGLLTYGCPFCDMPKPYKESEYNLLTLGDLSDNHEKYIASGSNKKRQSDYQNCINPSLLAGESSSKIISILYPPELHLMIGVVDKHLQGLEKVFGVPWVDNFLKNSYIVRMAYQGGHSLEGNQSAMFLEKLPVLELAIMNENDDKKITGLRLLESLRCFRQVKLSCFGQELKNGYQESIIKFSEAYRSLDIDGMTITPKIHIIEHHITDFLNIKEENNRGLGWFSEQAFESMHHDMQKEWNRVKISDITHPDFGRKLLNFVVSYNAKHI